MTTYGPSALWPADVRAQTDTLRWLFFGSCHLDPHYTTLLVERFIKPRGFLENGGKPAEASAPKPAGKEQKQ